MSEYTTYEVESSRYESVSLTVARRAALVSAIDAFLSEVATRGPLPQGANSRLPGGSVALPATPKLRLGQGATCALPAAVTAPGLSKGRGLHVGGAAMLDAQRLAATVKALGKPALRSLGDAAQRELREAAPVLQVVQRSFDTGDHAALWVRRAEIGATLEKLSGRLRETHTRLAVRERLATVEIVSRAMRDTGFATVRVQERKAPGGEASTVLRAEHQGTSVYAAVSSSGTIKVDTSGFQGQECRKTVERLASRMTELGLGVRRRGSVPHGADGGELVQEAKLLFDPIATPQGSVRTAAKKFDEQRLRMLAVAQQAMRNSVNRGDGNR